MRILPQRALRWKPTAWAAVLGLASMTVLAGCFPRDPIVWNTSVEPPLVCPGDSVVLRYNTAESEGGCLGDGCPDPIEVTVAVEGSPIAEGLSMRGASGSSRVGPVTGPTTFTFSTTGGRNGRFRDPVSHSVDTLIPRAESPVPLEFAARCSGDIVSWDPIDLSVPVFRSESVRLVRVCNTSSQVLNLILVNARDASGSVSERRWTLTPRQCTEDLLPEDSSRIVAAFIQPLTSGTGPVSCSTSSTGLPRPLRLQGILTCDLESASEPIVAATAVTTPTPEIFVVPTLTPEPTPTESAPPLTVNQDANCRKGPGSRYDVVTSLTKGTQTLAVGRNEASNWWLVQVPQTEVQCWVSGISLQGGGDPGQVPLVNVGPLPGIPGSLAAGKTTCSPNLNAYPVELAWGDSVGETGYRLYRNGALVATLGANAGYYADEAPKGTALTYELEAFNGLGKSERVTLSVEACP